ncbi:MAG: hypothetical protein ACI9H6_000117 [Patiriisocius sp.]|jgi:hypothetical protein
MNFNEYITTDLYEAVVLKYTDHKLECVDKTQRRAEFCFARRADTDAILKSYRERVLRVEPYAFSLCLRDIKDRLYNG